MMHGQSMAEGGHMMMGGGIGMMAFGLVYLIVVVVFLWLMYRGVVALEDIADSKQHQSHD